MNASTSIPGSGKLQIISPIRCSVAALVFPCILAASSSREKLSVASRVTVCLEKGGAVEQETLDRGEMLAAKILGLIGLKVEWRNQGRSCPPERDPIILNLTINTPRDYFPRAYGIAFPFEGVHASVFYDRIQRIRPELVGPLLGHVLAHEIVHILSGTDSHSETGVMKRQWSQRDLTEMMILPLTFSKLDMLLLNVGIRDRHARLEAIRNQATRLIASSPNE